MAEFRVWLLRNKESKWIPITADSLDDAVAKAHKKWRGRVLSVRPIAKRSEAA